MRALSVKLVRDLRRSGFLLGAIASIIVVGVMCFVAMQSAYFNLHHAKIRYYRESRMADAWIDLKKIPNAEVARVANVEGVERVESRIQSVVTVNLESATRPINGQVVSLPDVRTDMINDIQLRQGSYFTQRRSNEVIVSEKFARFHRLYPGQTIHVLLNQRRQPLVVVGTAIGSEFTYLLGPGSIFPDPSQFGVFFVKRSFAEEAFDFQGAANQLVLLLGSSHAARSQRILDAIERRASEYGVLNTIPLSEQASNQYLSNEIDGLGAIATVLPVIFLGVASVILNVLMTRLARQQRTTIGTLKALGYTHAAVFAHFVKIGLCVGLVGGLLGVVLGYAAATGMTAFYQTMFEFPNLRSEVHPRAMTLGLLSSLVFAALGSAVGARSALRLQPAEAMRPAPPRQGGAVFLERLQFLWRPLNNAWKMTLRNMIRARLRSIAGLFASMMGAGLLMSGFMMLVAQNHIVDSEFGQIARGDIDLLLEEESDAAAIDEIRALMGVDLAEPRLDVGCTISKGSRKKKTAVTGLMQDAQLTVPRDRRGHRIRIGQSGLVLSRHLSQTLRCSVGDSVTVTPTSGDRRPFSTRVHAIADNYIGISTYADIDYLSKKLDHDVMVNAIQLKLNRDLEQHRRLFQYLKEVPGVRAIQDQSQIVETVRTTLLQTQWISISLIVSFGGVIFFGSILNGSMVNLAERQCEVATFLALGYTHAQVGSMFYRESNLINVAGCVLGIPVGIGLTWLTAQSFNSDLIRLPILCPNWVWISTIALAILFGLAAQAVVQLSILRMNFVDALKVRE